MESPASHRPKFIVLTGGPGAGKTAVLEVIQRQFNLQATVLPEAAGIVFGGGFPRISTDHGRRTSQRAIFHVQRELEELVCGGAEADVILCDRGTLDGLAYWPGDPEDFFRELGTSLESELARYAMVIHLRTPSAEEGYNHQNPLRIESPEDAARIDARIGEIWARHPHRVVIENSRKFVEKLEHVLDVLRPEVPAIRR